MPVIDRLITVPLSLPLGFLLCRLSLRLVDPYLLFLVCCQLLFIASSTVCPYAVLAVSASVLDRSDQLGKNYSFAQILVLFPHSTHTGPSILSLFNPE